MCQGGNLSIMQALALVACILASCVAQEQAQEVMVPNDMACVEGPRSAQWGRVKERFRALFDGASGPFKPVDMETLVGAVKESVADVETVGGLSSPDAQGECGFGKLFIQLLSLVAVEDPPSIAQYFQEHTPVASPVLTMLLDIPWVSTARSGWPFFGVLAQIQYQKTRILAPMINVDAVDGLGSEPVIAFFNVMTEAQQQGDMLAMATASSMFLQHPIQGSPYATLTAMSTQAAMSMNIGERLQSIEMLQKGFKQAISTPSELDIALTIRWPMWGFLHVCVDVFSEN